MPSRATDRPARRRAPAPGSPSGEDVARPTEGRRTPPNRPARRHTPRNAFRGSGHRQGGEAGCRRLRRAQRHGDVLRVARQGRPRRRSGHRRRRSPQRDEGPGDEDRDHARVAPTPARARQRRRLPARQMASRVAGSTASSGSSATMRESASRTPAVESVMARPPQVRRSRAMSGARTRSRASACRAWDFTVLTEHPRTNGGLHLAAVLVEPQHEDRPLPGGEPRERRVQGDAVVGADRGVPGAAQRRARSPPPGLVGAGATARRRSSGCRGCAARTRPRAGGRPGSSAGPPEPGLLDEVLGRVPVAGEQDGGADQRGPPLPDEGVELVALCHVPASLRRSGNHLTQQYGCRASHGWMPCPTSCR